MQSYTLTPFTEEYLDAAVGLFTDAYRGEQAQSPLLPPRAADSPGWIRELLQARLSNPGVVVLHQDQVLAYLVVGAQFHWKGQWATFVPEYCHSAATPNRRELYQRMYMYLAQQWADNRSHLHIIGHFAHDQTLQETLYHLGFGAILCERLRDLSAIAGQHTGAISEESDVSRLVDIQIEHNGYYTRSPIFITKPTATQEVLAELEAHRAQGDVFLVSYAQDQPCGYMIVGESALGAEGFLLQHTNTAQIKSAYIQPGSRGKGVGQDLLQSALQWAQRHGYARLLVEHETANIYGGNFWHKYFSPYVYFSMRYIDRV